jgi:hypothetical protein
MPSTSTLIACSSLLLAQSHNCYTFSQLLQHSQSLYWLSHDFYKHYHGLLALSWTLRHSNELYKHSYRLFKTSQGLKSTLNALSTPTVYTSALMDSTSTHTNYRSIVTASAKPLRVWTALLRHLNALSRPQRALIRTPGTHGQVRDLLENRSTLTFTASTTSTLMASTSPQGTLMT